MRAQYTLFDRMTGRRISGAPISSRSTSPQFLRETREFLIANNMPAALVCAIGPGGTGVQPPVGLYSLDKAAVVDMVLTALGGG